MKLWLMRHAQPRIAKGVCYGQLDISADLEATQQGAKALAAHLPTGVRVYVSGLLRARQLADALMQLRSDLNLQVDTRLNEIDFGIWEGVAWDEIPAEAIQQWTDDFAHHRFGGKESTNEVLERVAKALRELPANEDAVWITHAGVIRAATYIVQHGDRVMASAAEWPVESPKFGEWQCLIVPFSKTT